MGIFPTTYNILKGSMWHADATHDTLLTTGNGGREPTRAQATLFYNGGESRYRVEKLLRPGEQIWLDLAKLIRNQIPDSDGHVLPPELTTGSYELRDLDHPLVGGIYEGKLVVDKTYGHASYGCAVCCGYVSAAFGVDPFGGPPDIDFGETVQAYNACSSRFDDVTGSVYGWGSSDTKVATLPNSTLHTVAVGAATGSGTVDLQSDNIRSNCPPIPRTPAQGVNVTPAVTISGSPYIAMLKSGATGGGNTTTLTATGSPSGGTYSWTAVSGQGNISISDDTSQTATITAVAVGTYTVQVTYTVQGYLPGTAAAVGKVQQPGSLGVVSNTTTPYNCALVGYAYTTQERDIQYQVLDTGATPAPIQALNMSATETLNITSNTCGGSLSPTVGAKTGTDGLFPEPDRLRGCSSKCLPADKNGNPTGSCQLVSAQTWSVNGYQVKSDTVTFNCPGPPTGAP